MMSPEELLEYWRRAYGETPLMGHVLRGCFPKRWLRIHSLPGSKRYAETEDEYGEILRRQNCLLTDLIGEGGPCEMVFGDYGEQSQSLAGFPAAALLELEPVFLRMLPIGESGLVADFPLLKASFPWREGTLDPILRAVADDVLETPLIISVVKDCIIAPYDGGVDIIVESRGLRDRLKARYVSWLSSHPAGL